MSEEDLRLLTGLSKRTVTRLKRNRITTVTELREHSPNDLLDLYQVGPTMVREIITALSQVGVSLAPEKGLPGLEIDLVTLRWRYRQAYLLALVKYAREETTRAVSMGRDLTLDDDEGILREFIHQQEAGWDYA